MHSKSIARIVILFLLVLVGASPALAQRGRAGGAPPHIKTGPQGRGPTSKPPHPTTPGKTTAAKHSPTTPSTATLTPQQHLAAQPKLAGKLQALIPGIPVDVAAQGFKNFGQFVAAVHVSNNLALPFADLKARMIGPNPESLGQAIQALRPAVNADAEVNLAEEQARNDLQGKS